MLRLTNMEKEIVMKIVTGVIAALGIAALAACGESPEEAAGDLAEQEMLSQEDILEEEADLAEAVGNEAQEEALDEQADAMGDAAGEAEDAAEAQVAPAAQ
jgi:hypothetical protein